MDLGFLCPGLAYFFHMVLLVLSNVILSWFVYSGDKLHTIMKQSKSTGVWNGVVVVFRATFGQCPSESWVFFFFKMASKRRPIFLYSRWWGRVAKAACSHATSWKASQSCKGHKIRLFLGSRHGTVFKMSLADCVILWPDDLDLTYTQLHIQSRGQSNCSLNHNLN